ncbi:MAG: hypothetical protein LBM12_02555 [Candidatus Nomurabacteria bacterium]|jgi:xylulose-5-phosphate/fructose-6-phosphate phosphoketolase|nr:hypothetical protein [Candidatus Nomurabacteria bacterium]
MRTVGEVQQEVDYADYLSVAQIYLQDNFELARPLVADDIKPRLLGHWGTCHGINAARANLRDYEGLFADKLGVEDFRFVVGVGHGYPAVQAEMWLDGTLDVPLEVLCKQFSWPHGFPSHTNPLTPKTILEGGELGYSLGVAYGAAMDAPSRLCAVVIGDGEMETGALLASLNLNKLLNMRENGIVLPILHLNGYKISQPSIYAKVSEKELSDLVSGFGYLPLFVEGDNVESWRKALDKCIKVWYNERNNPSSEADGGLGRAFRAPFIVMKTEKGEGVSKDENGVAIAGTARAHQVPFANAKTDPAELKLLEKWLKLYRFVSAPVADYSTSDENSQGRQAPCVMPEMEQFATGAEHTFFVPEVYQIGQEKFSSAKRIGEWLQAVLAADGKRDADSGGRQVRFLSPDETNSNRLDAVFAATSRAWQREILARDKDLATNGRVVELLSENTLFSLAMGYALTGRRPILASYEAFLPIVSSQVDQYMKFLTGAAEENISLNEEVRSLSLARTRRGDLSSCPAGNSPHILASDSETNFPPLTILSTSVGWRQDHNGYSHQNPSFLANLLMKPSRKANCYFPVDDVATVAAMNHAMRQNNKINLITFDKNENPRWIDSKHAEFQLENGGLSIFQFASDKNPEIICTAAGDIASREMLYAIQLVRERLPNLRLRFVGVGAMSYGAFGTTENPASQTLFEEYFGKNGPIVAAFHGYADTFSTILAHYTNPRRALVRGYDEKGSTTTPLDMLMLNKMSRYDLAIDILKVAIVYGIVERREAAAMAREMLRELRQAGQYIIKHGVDREKDVKWQYKMQS